MKILTKQECIQHGDFFFTRIEQSNNSYAWIGSNGKQLFDYVEMEMEKEYRRINPDKTLNPSKIEPSIFKLLSDEFGDHSKNYEDICKFIVNKRNNDNSEKKGFVNYDSLIDQFGLTNCYQGINEYNEFLKEKQANGETPEEANPVGQTIYTLSEIWKTFDEIFTKQGTDVMLKTALAMLPRHIKFNRVNSKPLTTTKEKPKPYNCLKRNCSNMITEGDFCSSDCFKEAESFREFED